MSISGIFNVNKPVGMTSHDVVAWIRRILRRDAPMGPVKLRVGHAGTLDPLATGVLLVCVGQATRLAEYLMQNVKMYRVRLQLGIATDTHDAEGEVVSEVPARVTEDEVRRVMAGFLGLIDQVPPMYSALKHQGTPLYKLARQGIEVQRAPRRVEIHELLLEHWSPPGSDIGPQLTIRVTCSSGTYIRALARDLGRRLGCGAHVVALTRLACGSFRLEEAISLEELAQAVAGGRLEEVMHPSDAAVADWPPLILGEDCAWRMTHGQPVAGTGMERGEWARVYSSKGEFLAIARWNQAVGCWQPHKVFVAS
jgi:tRNA pseudouridine55 synthase